MSEQSILGYCEIHKVQMKKIDGKYGEFWSHETDDERFKKAGKNQLRYCNGKLPDGQNGTQKPTESGDARIRLRIYELALSYAQDNMVPWIERAEKYIFESKILTENPFPPEE